MNCPACNGRSLVTHNRKTREGAVVLRRRKCRSCGLAWRTWERIDPTAGRRGRRNTVTTRPLQGVELPPEAQNEPEKPNGENPTS